ncbi:MAG: threonine-phosphate decarboxylase [Syntrophaceae bacterium]|nr:threonine-phosphate decarboxylase [Syntrophaceae bacterium]
MNADFQDSKPGPVGASRVSRDIVPPQPLKTFFGNFSLNNAQRENINEVAERHGLNPARIIDFSASINPLGMSPRARKKILKEGPEAILHFPDTRCTELRSVLAEYHSIPKESILPGAGSTEFIYSIPRMLNLERVLLVTPAFSEYENALEMQDKNCRIHFFETREEDGFELNVEGLLMVLTEGYDALYLCNPNDPTGIPTEKKDLLRVLARTEREKTWFILDETFVDFIPGESLLREAASSSRLIIFRSLSHFFALAGLRAGYMVSSPEVIRDFQAKREPWSVNALAQLAALESLRDRTYMKRTLDFIGRERKTLTLGLQGIPGFIPYPGSANYLLVQIHPSLNLTAAELRERLISRGILIRDCRSFHHMGPYFFRVAVRNRRENQTLIKALGQVQKEISKAGRGSRGI